MTLCRYMGFLDHYMQTAIDPLHKSHNAIQISHNAPFCNRNVHTCAHFCYKVMHCALWEMGLVHCGIWDSITIYLESIILLNVEKKYENKCFLPVTLLWLPFEGENILFLCGNAPSKLGDASPELGLMYQSSMVSCQKGPTLHAYAWQIGPFWQDTLELLYPI